MNKLTRHSTIRFAIEQTPRKTDFREIDLKI